MRIVINNKPIWINYHHLYCFYVIALSGSLSKASVNLGIGQSALSIQMKQFEASLGYSLFERKKRKLLPNEQGRIVLSYAKEIFRLGNEMVETIYDKPTAKRTHLQIGSLDTIPKHLTVQVVERALSEQKCTVSVVEGKQQELLKNLVEHRIDLLLTNFQPLVESGQVYSKCIARLPLWIVGSKKFLKLKKNFPSSLNGQPFVVPTIDSRVRHEFETFCKKFDVKVDYLAETQDVMVQKLLSLRSRGLTVMPEFAIQEYLDQKELFLIGKLPNVFEELYLVTTSRKIENPVASFLMKRFQISS